METDVSRIHPSNCDVVCVSGSGDQRSKILSCKVKSIDLDGRGSLAGSAGGLDYT
ncbi:MAG: hypothetical protein IPM86_02810 [Saprospiraceae bacterium]|nr:hypothetical protein [Saprospiraceae bacterium]